MWESWRAGAPIDSDRCATFADGLAVRVAIPLAVAELNPLVQRFELVSEARARAGGPGLRRGRHPGRGRGRGAARARAAGVAAAPARAHRHRPQHRRRALSNRILSDANHRIAGLAAASHDGDPGRPARRDGGGVRDHRAAEARRRARSSGTRVSKAFSPTCGCARGQANICFKLRRRRRRSRSSVLDANRRPVRILVGRQSTPRGPLDASAGTAAPTSGTRAPDGTYRAQIHLARQHQTILLPNRIQLDTTPPAGARRDAEPRGSSRRTATSRPTSCRITYELSKPAHVQLYLDGSAHPAARSSTRRAAASPGTGRRTGRLLPPGDVHARARRGRPRRQQHAGRRARGACRVEIRYITLASRASRASPGTPFEIGVSTDARRYTWQLGRRKGVASGPVLRLRAPQPRGPLHAHRHRARPRRAARRCSSGDRARAARRPGRVPRPRAAARREDAARPDRRPRLRRVRHVRPRRRASRRTGRSSSLGGASPRSRIGRGARDRVPPRCRGCCRSLALACVPVRIGVHVGDASSKLLVPLYVVILGATILLAWELVAGDSARARARARGVAARRVPRLDGRLARVEQGRAATARSSCSRSTSRSRCSRSRSRGCRGAGSACALLYVELDGDGGSCSRSSASTSTRRATSSRTRR